MGPDQVPTGDIAKALSYSEEQLFERIGNATSTAAGFRVSDLMTLIREGRAWWSQEEAALKPLICGNSFVKRVATGPALDIAQAVYSAIVPALGVELSIYACALIAKTGIAGWCASAWRERPAS